MPVEKVLRCRKGVGGGRMNIMLDGENLESFRYFGSKVATDGKIG